MRLQQRQRVCATLRAPPTTAVSSFFPITARIQQPLHYYAIAPVAIQFPMTAVGSDFLETEPLQRARLARFSGNTRLRSLCMPRAAAASIRAERTDRPTPRPR